MVRHPLIPIGLTALLGFSTTAPVLGQARDPEVTSDTSAYCDVLMDRISAMARDASPPPPTEVAILSREGERMCVNGQIRGGLMRLRRAIALLRHGEE